MNKILALAFCLALALVPATHAEDNNKKKKKQQKKQTTTQTTTGQTTGHNAQVQKPVATTTSKSNRVVHTPNSPATHPENTVKVKNNQVAVHQTHNNTVVVKKNRVITNKNSYVVASRYNWHVHHDHGWWRNHYHNFVLFGGGYYFWNAGYWYPAYGYDPAYSTYTYDEPIYGYNQLPPGQVISNVQVELQREGYYSGPVDGLIGPMTRDALARYQGEQGLIVTRAIDEPTLQSLGLA